jgi:Cyclin, N-terminal domain/Cyclin, C-terminal domain
LVIVFGYLTDVSKLVTFPSPYLGDEVTIAIEQRAVIVDWLVNIHRRFECQSDESLYLAVNIFDRFLANADDINNYDLQLVGSSCMLIATKFEEIYTPTIKQFVKVASKRFSTDDLLDMECEVLSKLQFRLMVPTGLPFLHRFLFLSKASETMGKVSKYYLERLLLEHDSLNEPPSLLAVACVCLALNHPQIRKHDANVNTMPRIVSRISRESILSHHTALYLSRQFSANTLAMGPTQFSALRYM